MGETIRKYPGVAKDQAIQTDGAKPEEQGPPQVSRRKITAALLGAIGAAGIAGCVREVSSLAADEQKIGQLRLALTGSGCYWCQTIGTPSSPGELRTTIIPTYDGDICIAEGFLAAGDGGGGIFYWDKNSTDTDNWGTVITTALPPGGRWKRVFSGPLSVRWFGAVGDNIADDTTAIQMTIDALSDGGAVYLPPGKYRITAPIVIPPDSKQYIVAGAGLSSKIHADFNSSPLDPKAAIMATGSYGNQPYLVLRDLELWGNWPPNPPTPTYVTGVYLNWAMHFSKLSNLYIHNFQDGICIGESYQLVIDTVYSNDNYHDGIAAGRTLGEVPTTINNLKMFGGATTGNGRYGLDVTGRNITILGWWCEANGTNNVHAKGCLGLLLNGYEESNDLWAPDAEAQIHLEGCQGAVISGVNISNWNDDDPPRRVVYLKYCLGVEVEGLSVEKSGSLTVHPGYGVYSENSMNVSVRGSRFNNISNPIYMAGYGQLEVDMFIQNDGSGSVAPVTVPSSDSCKLFWRNAADADIAASSIGANAHVTFDRLDGVLSAAALPQYFLVNVTYSELQGNGKQLVPAGPSESWRIIDFFTVPVTNFVGACSRGVQICDLKDKVGDYIYSVIPSTALKCQTQARWGTSAIPYSAVTWHMVQPTLRGNGLWAMYAEGDGNYTSGSLTIAVIAIRAN